MSVAKLPSHNLTVLPAYLTVAFVLVPTEHLLHVRLLLMGSCGAEGVLLGTDQSPFDDEP